MRLFLIIMLASTTTFSQIKPKKLDKVIVYVHTYVNDSTMFCGETESLFKLNSKEILFTSPKAELEVRVIKKGVGEHNSWVGISRGVCYLITALSIDSGMGLMFQPIDLDMTPRTDTPTIVISTINICEQL